MAARDGADSFAAREISSAPVAAGVAAPSALPQAPSHAINAVYSGVQWGSLGVGLTVTYSFLTLVPNYYSINADELSPKVGDGLIF